LETVGPFGWTRTEWPGLIGCIKDNFANFFRLENLRSIKDDNVVLDLGTGIEFAHLYGSVGKRKLYPGMIARDYERHSKTLRFMIRSFQESLDSERVLLIRQESEPAPAETILRFWDALSVAHPKGEFDLLLINKNRRTSFVDHPRIKVDVVKTAPSGSRSWAGDDESWNEIFGRHAPHNRLLSSDK